MTIACVVYYKCYVVATFLYLAHYGVYAGTVTTLIS